MPRTTLQRSNPEARSLLMQEPTYDSQEEDDEYDAVRGVREQTDVDFSGSTDLEGFGVVSARRRSVELEEYRRRAIELEAAERKINACQERESGALTRLQDAELLRERLKEEFKRLKAERQDAEAEMRRKAHTMPTLQPRESTLWWVDSNWFHAVGTVVVALNLACMLPPIQAEFGLTQRSLKVWNNGFLVWYIIELVFRFIHFGYEFLFGPWQASGWNWMDLSIVVSGIVDQWLAPLFFGAAGSHLEMVRLLRLFRIARIAKLVKTIFFESDLEFVNASKAFEWFMCAVVFLNFAIFSVELDYGAWKGWVWVDSVFLCFYSFEFLAKLKLLGRLYFVHHSEWLWNWLDAVVVATGTLDLWLIPSLKWFQSEVLNWRGAWSTDELEVCINLVVMLRMLRVLRLIKVVRSVPPLYSLLIGVVEAFRAMQWLIILVFLTLYGAAIVFTDLIGKGIVYRLTKEPVPPEAAELYGSVQDSFFALFELMCGNNEMIEPLKSTIVGRILSFGFMVVFNWAMLAILTAVVSENMISTSHKYQAEESERHRVEEVAREQRKLMTMFEAKDPDRTGQLERDTWIDMLDDRPTLLELKEGHTSMSKFDLVDLFDCLAMEELDDGLTETTEVVNYSDLVRQLRCGSDVADKKSVMHLMLRLRVVQEQLQEKLEGGFYTIQKQVEQLEQDSLAACSFVKDSPGCKSGTIADMTPQEGPRSRLSNMSQYMSKTDTLRDSVKDSAPRPDGDRREDASVRSTAVTKAQDSGTGAGVVFYPRKELQPQAILNRSIATSWKPPNTQQSLFGSKGAVPFRRPQRSTQYFKRADTSVSSVRSTTVVDVADDSEAIQTHSESEIARAIKK